MPEIGERYRNVKIPRRIFAFRDIQENEGVVWWNFIDINDGKIRSFYPDEVYPANQKKSRKKRVESINGIPDSLHIEEGRVAKKYIICGEIVSIL